MIKQNCTKIAVTVGKAFWALPFLGAIFFGLVILGLIWVVNPRAFSKARESIEL